MNFLSDLVGNSEDRFAHDTSHINQRFSYDLHNVSLQWQRLYNTYHICRDTLSFTNTYDITLYVDLNYEIPCISAIHHIVKPAIIFANF